MGGEIGGVGRCPDRDAEGWAATRPLRVTIKKISDSASVKRARSEPDLPIEAIERLESDAAFLRDEEDCDPCLFVVGALGFDRWLRQQLR